MVANFVNISDSEFSLNGVEYKKTFIPVKVGGTDLVRVVNMYDSRMVLVRPTRFSDYQVGGQTFNSVESLIESLNDIIYSRVTFSEEDKQAIYDELQDTQDAVQSLQDTTARYAFDTLQEAQDKWATFSQEEKDALDGKTFVVSTGSDAGEYSWQSSETGGTRFEREFPSSVKAIEGGEFNGVFDVSEGNEVYYDDKLNGNVVDFHLSSSRMLGSCATVRVRGSLTGNIPIDWTLSGTEISNSPDDMNEITIMYISNRDVRAVNRVINISSDSISPDQITDIFMWYDGTDSSYMEISSSEVDSFTDKIGSKDVVTAEGAPVFTGVGLNIQEGIMVTSKPSSPLAVAVDYHGYFIFKNLRNPDPSTGRNGFISNVISTDDRFAIGIRDGFLSVGHYDGTSFITKSTPFNDTDSYHKLEFKNKSGIVTALLDGVEMSETAPTPSTVNLGFSIGMLGVATRCDMELKGLIVAYGEISEPERAKVDNWIYYNYGV